MRTLINPQNTKSCRLSVHVTQYHRFFLNMCIICSGSVLSCVASLFGQCPTPTPGTSETAYVTIVHSDGTRTRYALPPNPSTTDRGCVVTYAKNQATAGDTIVVGPGEAEVKNLLKNGVNWSLADGVVLENTTDDTVGIFDDGPSGANGPVVSSISGRGVIKCTSPSSTPSTINVVNSGSNIHVQAKEASNQSPEAVIHQENGTGYFNIDRIDGTSGNRSRGVSWLGGETYVEADEIISYSKAIYSLPGNTSPPRSDLWVRAKKIQSLYVYAIGSVGTTNGSKIWVDAEFIGGGTGPGGAVFVTSNEVHITSQKIDNQSSDFGINNAGGALWVTAQKVTGELASATNAEFVSSGSSISHLDVLQWELLGNQSAAVNVWGGTVFASGRVWQTGTGDGFNCSGGTLYVEHANISTQTGHYDLVQSGSGALSVTGTVYDATKVSGTIRQGDPRLAIAPGYGTGSTLPPDGSTYQFFLNTVNAHVYGWNGISWVQLDN
jgi:hypothetical protein